MSEDDVAMMMVLVKVSRLANNPSHRDSQVDICGYTHLLSRIQAHRRSNCLPAATLSP